MSADAPSASAGKRERNKEQNRAAILNAARRCFMAQGLDGVSVRDIIRETGLATGTFYNYFSDKEEVFSALLEDVANRINAELHDIRMGANDLRGFLHDTYLHLFRVFASEPGLFQLLDLNEPYIRDKYQGSVLGLSMEYLKTDIRDAVERGILPEIDEEYLAAAFYGVGYEMSRVLVQREHPDPEGAAQLATRIFLEGMMGQAR